MSAAATCTDCTSPARGDVTAERSTPAHHCRQCERHCAMRGYVAARPVRLGVLSGVIPRETR